MLEVFNTEELMTITGLERHLVDYLRKILIFLPVNDRRIRWSYETLLLGKLILAVQKFNSKQRTITLIKKILEDLKNQSDSINFLYSRPFLMFTFLDDGIFACSADNTLAGELKLTDRFLAEKSHIIKAEKLFLPILAPQKTTLILSNVCIIHMAKLKIEVDDAINALDDSVEQELISQSQPPNTLEVAHRPLLR